MNRETRPVRWPKDATARAMLIVRWNWWLIEKRRLLQRMAGRGA